MAVYENEPRVGTFPPTLSVNVNPYWGTETIAP